jgi:shikimate dehydrogenase
VAARRPGQAEQLVSDFGGIAEATFHCVDLQAASAMSAAVAEADLIINTTPVGMYPHVETLPLEAAWLAQLDQIERKQVIVSDILYNPLETKLLKIAKLLGYRTHSGVGMFIHQGAYAFEYWTDTPAPLGVMRDTVMKYLRPR